MSISKLNIFFYVGLIISFLLAALTPLITNLPNGNALRIVAIVILGQAHFFIAYLYYIDILRINFSGNGKKFLTFLISFLALIVMFYLFRYVWFSAFATLITLFVFVIFATHHFENMFFLGEDFNQSFLRRKRSSLNIWLISYITSLVVSFVTYSYYMLNVKSFTIWIFLISFAVLCISLFKVYTKTNTYKMPLLLSPLLVFTGPFFLQNVLFLELRFFMLSWHFFAWLILYAFILALRNKDQFPKEIKKLPHSLISKFLRKTRENVWNYVMFNVLVGILMVFLYVLTSKIQGIAPLSDEMVYYGFFWGLMYLEMSAFAHIAFTIFPKKVG